MDYNKISEQLNKLIILTKQNTISWRSLNQNIVRWTKNDPGNKGFSVTLQVQPFPAIQPVQSPKPSNYTFSIQSLNPPELLMQLNTANEPLVRNLLKEL